MPRCAESICILVPVTRAFLRGRNLILEDSVHESVNTLETGVSELS
jgi:hypothetical protein